MSPYKLTKIEAPMRLSLAFNDAFNEHDIEGMLALVADECVVEHYAPAPDGTRHAGKGALAEFWTDFFTEFPKARRKIEDAHGLGKVCLVRWVLNRGDGDHLRGIDIVKVTDVVIVEVLSYVKG